MRGFFLVAGVGFEPHDLRVIWCFAPRHCLRQSSSPFAYFLNRLVQILFGKSGLIDTKSIKVQSHPSHKKTAHLVVYRIFMVAGVGFEPHDLRVMSPTSYQAALPRDDLLLVYDT